MGELELRVRERMELSPLRRIIAERMVGSLRDMAQVTLMAESVVDGMVEFRRVEGPGIEEEHGVKVTYTDILVKIVASLLRKHPLLNASLKGDFIEIYEDINVGVAVAINHGLVVPVVKAADRKSLVEVSREIKDLAGRARAGTLTLDDVSGGTFTVTNLGMYGVDGFTPIINSPQTAILGVGRIVLKPVVRGDEVDKANVAWLSLTFDHRVMDGHTAALFLQDLSRTLESLEDVRRAVGWQGS